MNAASEKETCPLPVKRWQFSLRELMLATLVLSVYLAVIARLGPYMGVLGGLALLAWGLFYIHRRVRIISLAELGIGSAVAGILAVFCALPTLGPHVESSRRMQCGNNLKLIALALQNYHDTYRCFPPAYIADSSGKPIHSWRVLILPFMDQKNLYARYRFNEPWDGPNNRLLHKEIVATFGCPSDIAGSAIETDYVVVVGPGTMFPDDKCTSASQIADGTPNTLLVAEVQNSGIHWMEPRDLHVTQMATTINPKSGQGVSSTHSRGAMTAFVDGHVQLIPKNIPPDQLRAILTIAGGEQIVDY